MKERKFFDSGDFVLSKATDDNITGHAQTGKEHPMRGNTSHLSSPVPSDSNLKCDANAAEYGTMHSNTANLSSSFRSARNFHEAVKVSEPSASDACQGPGKEEGQCQRVLSGSNDGERK